jgi:tetracycline 7-halogenase / FADH2 O2-dependent halogenase
VKNGVFDAGAPVSAHAGAMDGRSSDVVILGAGIGGSMLAAILARHGVQVLLIEADSHPRFTIGESTIPETAGLLRVLSERYSVPEIGHLATFQSVRHHVSSACGVKRSFSFVYHREGQPQRPEETTQFPTLSPPFGPDVHWFRQDIDSYMFTAAVRYGATARQRLRITEIERRGDRWLLASDKGERFEARFVVDAGGIRSPMAEAHGLRDDPPRQRTNSRSMFTHMVGVRPYDQCVSDPRASGLCSPFYQGTLHHIFDGGWLWVIPFDNHPDSTNPLCSVGLQLDRRKHPDSQLSAADEFSAFLKRFPSIAVQFEQARPVRDWTRSNGRLQFSSRRSLGDGYCLLPHAAGFIDPLFSSGLATTVSFVGNLAGRLIRAKEQDDFSTSRFAPLDPWLQRTLDHFDRLVSCSYDSWADFRLWNAWFRVWVLGNFFGTFGPISRQVKYLETGDARELARVEELPYRGLASSDWDVFLVLFDAAAKQVEAFQAGQVSAAEASERIFALLREADFIPPQLGLGDPAHRGVSAWTVPPSLRFFFWGKLRAPQSARRYYFDIPARPFGAQTMRGLWAELGRSLRTARATLRDHLWAWNREWTNPRYDRPAPPLPVAHLVEETAMPAESSHRDFAPR